MAAYRSRVGCEEAPRRGLRAGRCGSRIPEGAGRVKSSPARVVHGCLPRLVALDATNEVGVKMERPQRARTNDLDADEWWRTIVQREEGQLDRGDLLLVGPTDARRL